MLAVVKCPIHNHLVVQLDAPDSPLMGKVLWGIKVTCTCSSPSGAFVQTIALAANDRCDVLTYLRCVSADDHESTWLLDDFTTEETALPTCDFGRQLLLVMSETESVAVAVECQMSNRSFDNSTTRKMSTWRSAFQCVRPDSIALRVEGGQVLRWIEGLLLASYTVPDVEAKVKEFATRTGPYHTIENPW